MKHILLLAFIKKFFSILLLIFGNLITFGINRTNFPIGGTHFEVERNFPNHTVQMGKGSMLYIFSDGYADQFGGETGKKLMTKDFKKICFLFPARFCQNEKKNSEYNF